MTTQKSYTATPGPTLIDGAGLSVVIDDYLSERHEARVSVSAIPLSLVLAYLIMRSEIPTT